MSQNQILIENSSNFKLIGSRISNFVLFSKIKTSYLNNTENKNHQQLNYSLETFILAKIPRESQPQKNITFIRQAQNKDLNLNLCKIKQKCHSSINGYFNASFLRFVNLSYCRKLTQLLSSLGVNIQKSLEQQWLALYEVHNFHYIFDNLRKYQISSPSYGSKVIILHQNFKSVQKDTHYNSMALVTQSLKNSLISEQILSNFFKYQDQNFYVMSDVLDHNKFNDLDLITSLSDFHLHGVVFKIKQFIVCVPFSTILTMADQDFKIQKSILQKLYKTCYIQFCGSYCTGIMISQTKAISARHLLSIGYQKVDTEVYVRKFPYIEKQKAKIIKVGVGSLDFIQLQIVKTQKTYHHQSFPNHSNTNPLVTKHFLNGYSLQKQKQKQTSKKLTNLKNLTFNYSQNLYNNNIISTPKIGQQIVSLGFGRFSYNSNIFEKFNIVLPTISKGIVSKIISIKNKYIFLKTDAKLFSGFSGCGIWKSSSQQKQSNSCLLGMAVFILRNTNNNSHYNKHNFSYSINFLKDILRTQKQYVFVNQNEDIEEFDKIQSRKEFKIIEKQRAKL